MHFFLSAVEKPNVVLHIFLYYHYTQVTFQTVLVKSIMSDDGETEEQGPGFKGAFLHGLERIAPDVEETKGEREQRREEKSPRSVVQSYVTPFCYS